LARDPADPAPAPAGPPQAGQKQRNWRDLGTRTASAALLAPLFLAALWFGGGIWQALVLVIATGIAYEFWGLARRTAPLMLVGGLCVTALAALALVGLRGDPWVGRANMVFVVLLVWASDVGAYLVGRLAGGPKLAPRISPGKTWSGAAGGLVSAMLVGVAATLLDTDLSSAAKAAEMPQAVLVAAFLGLAAQAGDLLESALKRHVGVKDSGRLIPGHGGLLDRMDGLLLAAIAAACLGLILGQGTLLWQGTKA